MKKVLLFFALYLSVHSIGYGQSLPTRKEQHDFLRWYVKYRHLVPLDSSFKFAGDFFSVSIVSMTLKTKDKVYIKKQIQLLKKQFMLDSTSLRELNWRPDKQSLESYINYLSLPVFSVDRKTVVISWGIYCGSDCGKESIDVFYKSKDNKWRLSKKPVPIIVF